MTEPKRRGYTPVQLERERERLFDKVRKSGWESLTRTESQILAYSSGPCKCAFGIRTIKSEFGTSSL